MDGGSWKRGFMGLFGLVVVGAVAVIAYSVGAAHGGGYVEGTRDGMRMYGHGGFFFPFLFFPLGLLLFFGVMRALFGRRRWRGDYGGYMRGYGPGGGPGRLEEWHRRAHEGSGDTTPPAAPSGSTGTSGAPQA